MTGMCDGSGHQSPSDDAAASARTQRSGDHRVTEDRPLGYRPIDYRAVRQSIPLSRVLELLNFRPTGNRSRNLRGHCVLCGSAKSESSPTLGSSANPGTSAKRTRPCFAADLSRDIWHCFGCRKGGDQLTLWSLAQRQPLYAATKLLCQAAGLPIPWLN